MISNLHNLLNISWNLNEQIYPKVISLLSRLICNHQTSYIQYHYLLSQKHKLLKTALINEESPDKIKKNYEEITEFAFEGLNDSVQSHFKFMIDYFKLSKKSKYLPRFCIKTTHDNQVIDLFRFEPAYYSTFHSIDENTSIKYIKDNGIYHLCNDIPAAVKKGEYVNPRLNLKKVKNYKSNLFKKDGPDTKWADCWYGTTNGKDSFSPHVSSCYKSTLVIPMTLLNNNLSREFRTSFLINEPQKDSRTIFGFIGIDHLNTNYFNDDHDVKIGYIFADLISLYLITMHIYTDRSETFKRCQKLYNI